MKVEALIVMDAQEAVIVMHLAQVQLVTAATTTTANGMFVNHFLIMSKSNRLISLHFCNRSNRPRNKSPDNSGDPSESSKRR